LVWYQARKELIINSFKVTSARTANFYFEPRGLLKFVAEAIVSTAMKRTDKVFIEFC
jgi:hypothetical protein